MSSRSKGRRTLNKAKDYYAEKGYIVDEVELGGRFRTSKDLFSGLCRRCWEDFTRGTCACGEGNEDPFPGFDLIGFRPGKPVYLIQVKTNTPATQSPYKDFAKRFASKHVRVIVWTWYDRQGPRIQRYCKNGKIIEKDLR